jgi:hypothetical protein
MEEELCKCGDEGSSYPHTCPFAMEMSCGEDDSECNCCDECELNCAMDI